MRYIALCVILLISLDVRALVLSSIKPIDLIVRDLTAGEPASFVLLGASASPHHYSMKMSDARRLMESDVFIWVGPELEAFLTKPVRNRVSPTLTLSELFDDDDKSTHQAHDDEPSDESDHEAGHENGHENHHHDHEHGHHGANDSHIWLSYDNAVVIAKQLAETLSKRYPQFESQFNENLKALVSQLQSEKALTSEIFDQIKSKGLAVYHDGYSAYVNEFGLVQLAHVTQIPDEQISLKKLMTLKHELAGASCLLGEEAEFTRVKRFAQKLGVRPVAVDLLGLSVDRSRDKTHFVQYMRNIRDSFVSCLSEKNVANTNVGNAVSSE